MDPANHTTDELNAMRRKLAGWDVPFDGDREALIEDIRRLQDCADRHIQSERPGVVF